MVEAGEQVFLGHPEDACQHRLVEMGIPFEPGAQEGPQKFQDPRAVAVDVPGVDGLVVLVEENDDLLAVVGVEIAREVEQGAIVERL